MNFLAELREVARVCVQPAMAMQLRVAADELDDAIVRLADDPTRDAMVTVNGAWVRAMKVLAAAPPMGGDGTAGGAMPVPLMRAAA